MKTTYFNLAVASMVLAGVAGDARLSHTQASLALAAIVLAVIGASQNRR
jgi:hypothetical protein